MSINTFSALLIFGVFLPLGQPVEGAEPDAKRVFRFAVMGDVPYAEGEFGKLERQLEQLPDDVPFVFHVGDIKRGSPPCDEQVYARVAKVLSESPKRLFIIPGDNEWNDCRDPDAAWKFWTKYFHLFDQRWKTDLKVARQAKRSENLAFSYQDVLFVGLNVVGGRVHDPEEWKRRLDDDARWLEKQLKQAGSARCAVVLGHAFAGNGPRKAFRDSMLSAASTFGKPVLYLHGDGHRFKHDRPYPSAPKVTRVQVDQGGIAAPLLVSITNDVDDPFEFDRRGAPEK